MRACRTTSELRPRLRASDAHATARRMAAALTLLAVQLGCASHVPDDTPAAADPPPSAAARVLAAPESSEAAERERAARRAVQDARAFLIQSRFEAALRATNRGLLALPDDPALLRARARALDALDRAADAAAARARADRLDPPPAPLPTGPMPGRFDDLLIVLQAPDVDFASTRDTADARHAALLEQGFVARLEQRLPGVKVVRETEADTPDVPSARRWLESEARPRIAGVRIVRALCGESIKDGRYAVASIHRTLAAPIGADGPVRASGMPEADGDACPARALDRTLESWLDGDAWFFASRPASRPVSGPAQTDTGHPTSDASSGTSTASTLAPRETILALLPGLDARIRAEHAIARRAFYVGDLARARAAYERAAALDPEDDDIAAHLSEIDATLTLNRELALLEAERKRARSMPGAEADAADDEAGWLPAALSPAQRAALEGQLEGERRRRDDLLATLATVSGDRRSAQAPEAARASNAPIDPASPGVIRALAQLDPVARDAQGAEALDRLVVRTLHGPSGSLVARYYFDARAGRDRDATDAVPILVEEDASGDGVLDRWTAYRAGLRTEVWETRRDEGVPDLHTVYADDGHTLVRLELDEVKGKGRGEERDEERDEAGDEGRREGERRDAGYDGLADRVYDYEAGVLVRAAHDTDGDGRLDRFDRFDEEGRVAVREEDLTGDGRIDVRSLFLEGRLVKREIMEPEWLEVPPAPGADS